MVRFDDLIARLEDGEQCIDAVDDAIHELVILRDRVAELEQINGIKLSRSEGDRLRQWFHSLQDVNPKYLEPEDYVLIEKITGEHNE